MADAVSRMTSGQQIGVFAMQHGPGTENAFGGVAQAYGDSAPIVVLPGGYPRRITNVKPNFSALLNYQHVTKWCEQLTVPAAVSEVMRRAFTQVRNGRPQPVLVEFPVDLFQEDVPEPFEYTPAPRTRFGPDPQGRRHGGRGARGGAATGHLRRPGRALRAGLAAAARAGRAAGGAGDHEPRAARAPSPRTTRSRSAPAAAPSRRPSASSSRSATSSSASAAASRRPTSAWPCPRARRSSTPRSTRWTSTRTSRPSTRSSATPR